MFELFLLGYMAYVERKDWRTQQRADAAYDRRMKG